MEKAKRNYFIFLLIAVLSLSVSCKGNTSDNTDQAPPAGIGDGTDGTVEELQLEQFGTPDHSYIVEENAAAGTEIAQVPGIDNSLSGNTYTIQDNDSPLEIDSTGVLKVKTPPTRTERANINLKVQISNGSTTETVKVTVFVVTSDSLSANKGKIKLDTWSGANIDKSGVIGVPADKDSDSTSVVTSLDIPDSGKDDFASRYYGYLIPSETGNYQFSLNADDIAYLNLSTTGIPKDKTTIDDYSIYDRDNTGKPSASILLLKGKIYYIEVLHREGGGGDVLQVSWKKQADTDFSIIDSSVLYLPEMVDTIVPNPPKIALASINAQAATIIWEAPADDIAEYILYRDDQLLTTLDADTFTYVDTSVGSGVHTYIITAKDSFGNVSDPAGFKVDTSADYNGLEAAIKTGNPTLIIGYEEILQAGIEVCESAQSKHNQVLEQIYGSNPIEYSPNMVAGHINPADPFIVSIVVDKNAHTQAGLVENENNRLGVFSDHVFQSLNSGLLPNFSNSFKNILLWLLKSDATNPAQDVSIAVTGNILNDVKNWITPNFASWDVSQCDDYAQLDTCYSDKDLIVIGSHNDDKIEPDELVSILEKAVSRGTPILYTHTNSPYFTETGNAVLNFMGFNDFASGHENVAYANYNEMVSNDPVKVIKDLLIRFRDDSFTVDLSGCSKNYCGDTNYISQFKVAAENIRFTLNSFDKTNQYIFSTEKNRLYKILALIGDKFREEIVFPMDKSITSSSDFFKSLFADYSVYNSRTYNPAQPDMGNFSRSDFSHITPVEKTITMVSRKSFRAAGLYALPGQEIMVTRNDTSAVKVSVFVNSVREGSTHEFGALDEYRAHAYTRPKFLQSAWMVIEPGETISFVSPYGGPLQIAFDTNDLEVSLTFENVGEHPVWRSSADNAVFTQKLAANEYDWAEILTNGFEVHSTLDKMNDAIARVGAKFSPEDYPWTNAEELAAATTRYIGNYPYVIAGFQGEGIDVEPEITDWANGKGFTLDTVTTVQHMNADLSTCGFGCSGNPYDAFWAFNPLGHGDLHELGHNLQAGKQAFVGWGVHSLTNIYPYYTQSKAYRDHNFGYQEAMSLEVNFKRVFNWLKESLSKSNPADYLKTTLWVEQADGSSWADQFAFLLQSCISVQNMGKLTDGWHLIGRLHVLEREFNRSLGNDATWDAKKESLGFSSYTREEASSITNNDWMVVAMSYVSGVDFRDYVDMWGLPYTQKARDQVGGFGFTSSVPRRYYLTTGTGYTSKDQYGELLDRQQYLDVNGSSSWPADFPE